MKEEMGVEYIIYGEVIRMYTSFSRNGPIMSTEYVKMCLNEIEFENMGWIHLAREFSVEPS
jgi:hypothetical protein